MSTCAYSSADLLEKQIYWNSDRRKGIFDYIEKFILDHTKTISFQLELPTNLFIRTKLLCEYIKEQAGFNFGVHDFLMVLYLDFINSSIKKYDPIKIYRLINYSYDYDDTLKIVVGNDIYIHKKRESNISKIIIPIEKSNVLKGEMLLAEIDELYGHNISFEKMLSNLWINFIETYKKGDNDKALNDIIKMLKKNNK